VSETTAVRSEPRFEFGENWARFAAEVPEERLEAARGSLQEMLGRPSLEGLSFLDVGSGSGLFSLAAKQLGAPRVHSFDSDESSVATTASLRERFADEDGWTVERGSALDEGYLRSLGQWDIVYAWGVLHHTGDMWRALGSVTALVRPGGRLFISIYNDQGWKSRAWRWVKRTYNGLPPSLRRAYVIAVALPLELRQIIKHLLKGRPLDYYRLWRSSAYYERGMSYWHDIVDWVGGYPFEVASPEEVFHFCAERGFELRRLRTVRGSHGCNEFVFARREDASSP
jgi:2-polyprenyl-3-methyl-5-hydroxy-6-metoxy-1,4-benzoquinol methylase